MDDSLEIPFWINLDAYSDRDKHMFVCGFEFAIISYALGNGNVRFEKQPIHTENESRIRMYCGKIKVRCTIEQHCDTWSLLTTELPHGRDTESEVTEG